LAEKLYRPDDYAYFELQFLLAEAYEKADEKKEA
jgi:hypothetical protein